MHELETQVSKATKQAEPNVMSHGACLWQAIITYTFTSRHKVWHKGSGCRGIKAGAAHESHRIVVAFATFWC